MTTVENIVSGGLAVRPKRFRVDEFRRMTEAGILPEESGWEIIDGYLIDKMTVGSRHSGVVKRLIRLLTVVLGEDAIVSVQDPVEIDDYNEPEPDVAVLKIREDFYSNSHPKSDDVLLLIEVSESTLRFDREIKLTVYAVAGVAEVWLVNLIDDAVERYSAPANGRYGEVRTFTAGVEIGSVSVSELVLKVADILGM